VSTLAFTTRRREPAIFTLDIHKRTIIGGMDKLTTAYKSALLENYANFSGRLSVPGFWWFALANFLVYLVLLVLSGISGIFFILYRIYSLAVLVPSLAAAVRRLHDTNKSGWMILLGLIPLVGVIILLVFYVQAGTPGPNDHGAESTA
jgi:uncharacterized membrane protein YhaH (DUF805 family)